MKKRTKPKEEGPNSEGRFIAMIVLFNSLGFCFIATGVTYVDARLTTHYYGVRHYRWGYWVAACGGLVVLLATLLSLKKGTSAKVKTFLPLAILWVTAAASLPLFLPEFPHGAIASWNVYLSIVSLFSCAIHYAPLGRDWLTRSDLSEQIKLERVRQYASQWRTVAVTMTVGYLAMLIPWTSFLWTSFPAAFVTAPAEKVRLSQFGSAVVRTLLVRTSWHCV